MDDLITREKAKIDRCAAAGTELWIVLDGIADDENLEGVKGELMRYAEVVYS